MAVKKSTKKTRSAARRATKALKKRIPKKTIVSVKSKSIYSKIFENLRLGESYTSLVLGIIAVVIATVLLLSFFSNRQGSKPGAEPTPTIADVNTLDISPTQAPIQKPAIEKTYTIVVGDTLWSISEKTYGSGYNWVNIAKANNLANPGQIFAGNKLILPSVNLKDATVMTGEDEAQVSRTVRIADETYAIVKGDDLWNIAVRSYGDGYQWVKIAKSNNLANPGLIHPGNVLKIPRN